MSGASGMNIRPLYDRASAFHPPRDSHTARAPLQRLKFTLTSIVGNPALPFAAAAAPYSMAAEGLKLWILRI